MLSFLFKANDVVESDFQKEATTRFSGRDLKEIDCVRILWSKGVLFSKTKGRARRNSPLRYLLHQKWWMGADPMKRGPWIDVPSTLKYVVLTDKISLGNKTWGRIDYLVNYRGYQLVDERKK